MPGRKFDAGTGYRYGFNGKEKSDEVCGEGNVYDYGFRIYNPRIGRFLSTDPLTTSYPWYTPYQFAGNMPIVAIDLDGLEEYVVTNYFDEYNKLTETVITKTTNQKTGKRENMRLKNDGEYVTEQNVLIRNVSYNGKTSHDYQSGLNKSQKNIVEKAKAKTIYIKQYIYFGYDASQSSDDQFGGDDYLESESPLPSNMYNTTEYSSKAIRKPIPKKVPVGIVPVTKDLPIAKVAPVAKEYNSKIRFWANTAATQGSVKDEVDAIVSLVSGKSDYTITISGNIDGAPGQKFTDKANIASRIIGYQTYGELAIARANEIKQLLVTKGLDPNKIETKLGNPEGGWNATYKISTTE